MRVFGKVVFWGIGGAGIVFTLYLLASAVLSIPGWLLGLVSARDMAMGVGAVLVVALMGWVVSWQARLQARLRKRARLHTLHSGVRRYAEEAHAENMRILASEGPDVLMAKMRERYLPEWERDLAERERWLLSEKESGRLEPGAAEMELKRLRDYRSRRRAAD